MVYQGAMLLAKLRHLQLVGKNEDGELEWMGTDNQWGRVDNEAEGILREWDYMKLLGFNPRTERYAFEDWMADKNRAESENH